MKVTPERIPIERIVLATLGIVGLIAVAAVAPGLAPALKQFGVGKKRTYKRANIAAALNRLERKGLVTFASENGKKIVTLTKRGERRLAMYRMRGPLVGEQVPRWDGTWSLVAFDIAEKGKKIRDQLRYDLAQAGFVRLQHSVWVYPHACSDFVQMLKVERNLGQRVLYFRTDTLENDLPLRRHFKLL